MVECQIDRMGSTNKYESRFAVFCNYFSPIQYRHKIYTHFFKDLFQLGAQNELLFSYIESNSKIGQSLVQLAATTQSVAVDLSNFFCENWKFGMKDLNDDNRLYMCIVRMRLEWKSLKIFFRLVEIMNLVFFPLLSTNL